jgi:adenine C2-methylase RlmN of 23S rRNA A2503 and tRNA A37
MENKIIKCHGIDYILADKVKISFEHAVKLLRSHKVNNINDIQYNETTNLWHCIETFHDYILWGRR